MTDSRKLEIDLTEKFQHLAHAPIVEAVIEIRARAQNPWEESDISQRFKPLLPDYPKVVSQGQVQQEITLSPDQPKSVVHNMGWHGLHCQSADEKQIARFTRDGFLFARLHPYQNWEQLFGEAMRLWRIHTEIANPLEIQRVGLRYINRIEMQPGEARCEDYIELHPQPTKGLDLPFVSFFHQDTLAVPGHSMAINAIRTLQPPQTPSVGHALILDIDVFTTTAFEMNDETLVQRLQQMRWLKNKVFFGNVTEKAVDLFK
jgi:uncharacterized protein (TIGR04255 family)